MAVRRYAIAVLLALACAAPLASQDAPASVVPGASVIADRWRGLDVALAFSRAVPWRVFTLDAPPRLAVEVRDVTWPASLADFLSTDASVEVTERGTGWSRLEIGLNRPLAVEEAGMIVDRGSASALLRLSLVTTDADRFAAQARTETPMVPEPPAGEGDDAFVVAIDPGHGGFDPGAERGGLREAHLMLALGTELAAALEAAGIDAVLTREDDSFVPLEERIARARRAGADVIVSLHADSVEEDAASGASVYTLTADAAAGASDRAVERNAGTDLLSGQDLTGQDDAVAAALMDLARGDTNVRSARLAQAVVGSLAEAGAAVNTRPLRHASLAVLMAADMPGVLLETGFLSDDADRARLATPEGRAPIVQGVVAALSAWARAEASVAPPLDR